jgi:hypothetical protein
MSSLTLLRHHASLACNPTATSKVKSLLNVLAILIKYLGYFSLAYTLYKFYLSRLSKKNKNAKNASKLIESLRQVLKEISIEANFSLNVAYSKYN